MKKSKYEILSYTAKEGDIHSVKRLSDGIIITVGHAGKLTLTENKTNIKKVIDYCISKLEIKNNKLIISYDNDLLNNFDINACLEGSKIQPLFTTDDGVDIYQGDKYVLIFDDFHKESFIADKDIKIWTDGKPYYRLSSKEKAYEYILMNKPCLSLNDLLSVWGLGDKKHQANSPLFLNFKELLKSKL
jgi:hypothetical protein